MYLVTALAVFALVFWAAIKYWAKAQYQKDKSGYRSGSADDNLVGNLLISAVGAIFCGVFWPVVLLLAVVCVPSYFIGRMLFKWIKSA